MDDAVRRPRTPGVRVTISDEILISRCAQGDELAWDALIRRYAPLVRAVARRFNFPHDTCDDICQAVFQALVENLPSLRSGGSVSGWLAAVTRNHCHRHLQNLAPPPLPAAEFAPPPNIALQEWEERCELMRAIERLPEPCRDLIHALFLDPTCPSYAEIAQRLNRPIGSLGPMRRRCLTRLATSLVPVFGEPAAHVD